MRDAAVSAAAVTAARAAVICAEPFYTETSESFVKKVMSAAKAGDAAELSALLTVFPGLVHLKDSLGNTPLHYAVGSCSETVHILCRYGADPLAKNNVGRGFTPLEKLEELRAGDFFCGKELQYGAMLGYLKLAAVVGE